MKKQRTVKMKVGELIPNPLILEVRPVNDLVVSQYRQHMRAGCVFPRIVALGKTKGIVSGHHRHRAYMLEYGEGHVVDVMLIDLKTDAEALEYAVRENIAHGMPMDGISRKRAIVKLRALGREPEAIANLFGVSVKRVETLASLCVVVRGEPRAVKRGLEHIAGTKVAEKQYDEHERMDRGVPAWQTANQLVRWIRNGWVNMEDAKTFSAMEQLHAALAELMADK